MNKNLKRESQVRIKRLWQQTYFQKTLETNFFFKRLKQRTDSTAMHNTHTHVDNSVLSELILTGYTYHIILSQQQQGKGRQGSSNGCQLWNLELATHTLTHVPRHRQSQAGHLETVEFETKLWARNQNGPLWGPHPHLHFDWNSKTKILGTSESDYALQEYLEICLSIELIHKFVRFSQRSEICLDDYTIYRVVFKGSFWKDKSAKSG